MTRAEASQKWCPFAIAPITSNVSEYVSNVMVNKQHVIAGNRLFNAPDANCRCIHEQCMMWSTPLNDPDHGSCGMSRWNG